MIELEQYFTLVLCLVGNSAPATKTTLQKILKKRLFHFEISHQKL